MRLRIYRTWTWELAVPLSEVRFGGRNPMALVPHDELQYQGASDDWYPVPVTETPKPENPQDKKDREQQEAWAKEIAEKMKAIPADRSKRTLLDGSPVPDDYSHTQDRGDGQQKNYIVLTPEERAKGFVRPVRHGYLHNKCGALTTMGQALAETYARDPGFYDGTFCARCKKHFPLDEFVWDGTDEKVGA